MNLLECLWKAEELSYPRSFKMRDLFWPLLTDNQKREYYKKKWGIIIAQDVDYFLEKAFGWTT